uniref:ZP domain-containing protein n=1 Tax=Leptobrachium leishanense TaxID=445787 RepID=A0A8C5LNZ3_9ANUR
MTMKVFLRLIFALCGVVPVLRASTSCASDEVYDSNNNVCNCNTSFYTPQVSPPTPVIECSGGNMKLSISKCQLDISQFNASDLHLNSGNCLGTVDNESNISNMVLTSPLRNGACGNILNINESHVTYSNTLFISPKINTIITRRYFNVSFSCSYPLKTTVSLNTTLKPVMGVSTITVPGANGQYIVTMLAWINEEFNEPLTEDTVVRVEDTIYISVIVPELDANFFALYVNRIYASASPGSTEYNLLSDGCPATGDAEGLMSVRQNGNGTEARFAMKVFKITSSDFVNLFADVSVCNGTCVKSCSIRSAKSEKSTGDTATVSVTLSAEDTLQYSSSTIDRFSVPFTISSLFLSLLFVKLM